MAENVSYVTLYLLSARLLRVFCFIGLTRSVGPYLSQEYGLYR